MLPVVKLNISIGADVPIGPGYAPGHKKAPGLAARGLRLGYWLAGHCRLYCLACFVLFA